MCTAPMVTTTEGGLRADAQALGAPIPEAIEQRLTELEIKASYAEDLVDSLNQTVARQQQDIQLLARQLGLLRAQLDEAGTGGATRSPRDELPPHY